MGMTFKHIETDRFGNYYVERDTDGLKQSVHKTNKEYLEWVAAGNTPPIVHWTELSLSDYKDRKRLQIRSECRNHILSNYDDEDQRNALFGFYTQAQIDAIKAFVNANRLKGKQLIQDVVAAADYDAVDAINWSPA